MSQHTSSFVQDSIQSMISSQQESLQPSMLSELASSLTTVLSSEASCLPQIPVEKLNISQADIVLHDSDTPMKARKDVLV